MHTYRAQLDRSCGGLFKSLAICFFLTMVAAIVLFSVYGALAYHQGKHAPEMLASELDSKLVAVADLSSEADALQAVVNGTRPVAGVFIASAFQPDAPMLRAHSQARTPASNCAASVLDTVLLGAAAGWIWLYAAAHFDAVSHVVASCRCWLMTWAGSRTPLRR